MELFCSLGVDMLNVTMYFSKLTELYTSKGVKFSMCKFKKTELKNTFLILFHQHL